MEDFIGKFNGDQIDAKLEKVKDMVGATASAAGAAGLVPAPAAGKQTSFLRGDGTWAEVSVNDDDTFVDTLADVLKSKSVTRLQYDTMASYLVDVEKPYIFKPSDYFVRNYEDGYLTGYVLAFNLQDGSGINVMVDAVYPGYPQYINMYEIKSDLSLEYSVMATAILAMEDGSMNLLASNPSFASVQVYIQTKGQGNKALMDDGTYKEVQAKDDVEDSFLTVISQLAGDQPATLSQSQYDTIKSLFKGSTTSSLKIVRPSESFVEANGGLIFNDLTVIYDHSADSINVLISGSGNAIDAGFVDLRISVYSNLSVEYISSSINIVAGDNSGITLAKYYKSTEYNVDADNQLHFMITGRGDKALMDNGSYQNIRGIDISSYLLEPDTITIVSSITKSKYDDIKSYILNNNHMYLSFSMSDSGTDVVFNSDIMASYIYDAAYLVFFDPNVQKMSKIKIDYDTYEVSTIVI